MIGLVVIPHAPLMLLRCLLANTEGSFWLKGLLFAAGAVCPQLPFRPAPRHDKGDASAGDILQYVTPHDVKTGEMI